ncbi:MAG: M48 family metalloprotease [Kordia sp.]|uniref:M48 family metalloprotease n=1 Tax=Kordia sp. TaxID=1965332 RepID=UPI00385BB031
MRGNNVKIRLLIGLAIVAFAFFKKCTNRETNQYTGRTQTINMSIEKEIAIGFQNRNAMANEYGGLYPDPGAQARVDMIGAKLVNMSMAKESGYQFEFHLLADNRSINAFALPGGQIFITNALYSKLDDAQLAGVLGHEIGHVLGRHSAERIAESDFWQTVTAGASVGADMGNLVGSMGQNKLLKNGRNDEIESDKLGVELMMYSGYNPEAMIEVMQILKAAAGPNRVPEFQSTHPDPDNRIEKIKEVIDSYR